MTLMLAQLAGGIPSLPDLTQPQNLLRFGSQVMTTFMGLTLLLVAIAIALAILNLSLRRDQPEAIIWGQVVRDRVSTSLHLFQHTLLVLLILVVGFFLCSTLANRYHYWEQARVAQVASSVAGARMEQRSPQLRYEIQEPYTAYTQVENRVVETQRTRPVSRTVGLSGSQIEVKLNQAVDAQNRQRVYLADFQADYQVSNPLTETTDFWFEAYPPDGYSLLRNFRVERDGTRLQPTNPDQFSFPIQLKPGETAKFRVAYQAQGGSRWIYNATGQLLANFRLTAHANFSGADFASGIVPTEIKGEGEGTRFTWVFDDNVSVQNPFGVFTATSPIQNTGVMPRLLLLAPGLLLWWLLLLYFSMPLRLRDVAIASGLFFACLLALTYMSRSMDAKLAWAGLSVLLLSLTWGLGARDRRQDLTINRRHLAIAATICTIAGAIVPVFALLIPTTGLTLSLAGLLSVIWLTVRRWYGWLAAKD